MTRRTLLTLQTLDERITPAAGQLDPTFGTGGIVTTPIGPTWDESRTVAIDDQDRIVVGGRSMIGNNWDFSLSRYLPDGSLDTSFDGDGKVITTMSSLDENIYNLALDSLGRIVVGGWIGLNGNSRF